MTTETTQPQAETPTHVEYWRELTQQKSPEELWHDLQTARFWFKLTAMAAFFGSLFFSVSYFCGGNLEPHTWDGENWGNAGLGVLITAGITIFQYRLYLARSAYATRATLLAGLLAAFFGIFSEVSHSLSREEASVRHRSQSSPVFQAMLNQINNSGTSAPSSTGFESQIAKAKTEMVEAKMKLARCEANVAKGKWKDCIESTTRFSAIQGKIADLNNMAKDRISNQLQAQQQTTLAMAEKAKTMEYDESQSYPMIRAFKELLGFSTIGAGLLFSLIVMGVFEYAFHWQGHNVADLEFALRHLGYNTGKFKKRPHERMQQFKRKAKQFSNEVSTKLDTSGVIPSGYGFKMNEPVTNMASPSIVASAGTPIQAKAETNTPDAAQRIEAAKAKIEQIKKMKAEQAQPEPLELKPASTEKSPIGFVNTQDKQQNIQGTHDHQYPLYLSKALSTGKANTTSEAADFVRKTAKKQTVPEADSMTVSDRPSNTVLDRPRTVENTVPGRSETVKAGTVQDGGKSSLTDDAKQVAINLYPEWIKQVRGREISPGARPGKKFISQQTKNGKSSVGLTIQEMERIWQVWQKKAAKDGVLKVNPKYEPGKTGVAKYVLA